MKPLIGINLDVKQGPPQEAAIQMLYVEAIQKSGGIPILLPPMEPADLSQIIDRLDGIMLIGGADYCPSLYKEEKHESVELCSPLRQSFDLELARQALERQDLPILGICLGSQLLNINLGGTLVQDIKSHMPESKVEHSTRDGWKNGFNVHRIKLVAGSKLYSVFNSNGKRVEEFDVPTSHHQSVKAAAPAMDVVAFADDGIAEAVEMRDREFVIGVQWHPERDYINNKPLFDTLCRVAAR
ncbi:MAG: gamma-glutamyl-gamma-aminobutyrate hydrolase family protein [Candidatus Melainabacteria bacterium]|jgi:putative glutamine amidotransferase|nr:gamma-glutamyl-gamma-aminobutyrate hydrolase family protein [Candidatus Melainabacteria bacterium]MBX9674483.1 gamma-glutamyl-gamma-aminobutyrate hydrolase family protein [Candidatus Obscuribacterales bacterium]